MPYDRAFIAKVMDVLETVIDEDLAQVYNDRMYFASNPSSEYVFPYAIYQSQDGGGRLDAHIGQNGWTGFITFRSIHTTKSGARAKLLELANVIAANSGIFNKNGYSVGIELEKPQDFPIEHTSDSIIYTVGMVTLVSIYPNT